MTEPVAIVGMSVLFPGAADLQAYWRNLRDGVDAIAEVPDGRWDPDFYQPDAAQLAPDRTYCRRGGFLPDTTAVDLASYGIMPDSAGGTEPDQLIALRVADAAIADTGGRERLGDPNRIGVILGRGGYLSPGLARFEQRVRAVRQITRTLAELLPSLDRDRLEEVRQALLRPLGPMRPESTIGLVPNLTASRIANRLDLRGPAYTVDAACASSLVALDQAVAALSGRRCDAVLAGGVHHCHDETLWSVFTQLGALSRSGRIRPLSSDADGLLIGEGTGVVVLKRLADARRDGDRVYAVVRGVAVSSDGRTGSLVSPDPTGQMLAVRRAWQQAGLDPAAPDALGLLEAHGTATRAGDEAELSTVARVFGRPAGADAVIGSVKSMIGHTMPAAGVAGLVKAALALHNSTLLPTLHCENPHPGMADTRFVPIGAASDWPPPGSGEPRRAAVNAFGFGGINAHVVLEEDRDADIPRIGTRKRMSVSEPEQLLRLVAPRIEDLRDMLAAEPGLPPVLNDARGCRLAVVDPTEQRRALARKVLERGQRWAGRNDIWFAPEPLLAADGRTAVIFPGLEGQFEPRCADVAVHFGLKAPRIETGDVARDAASVLEVGRFLFRVLENMGVRADALAGHSVGEWTAMAAAGMYDAAAAEVGPERLWPDGVRLPGLDFAALGCAADRAAELIRGEKDLVVSHDNAPRQTIVCGAPEAIARLVGRCRDERIFARPLPFRSGFHTPMVAPFLDPFVRLAGALPFAAAAVPVWSATTCEPYPAETDRIRELYLRHLVEPVRFRELVLRLFADGIRAFVVAGPGQLGSFVEDTLADQDHLVIAANSSLRSGMAQLTRVAAALWADGGSPSFDVLLRKRPKHEVPVALAVPPLAVDPDAYGMLDRVVEPTRVNGLDATVAAEFVSLMAETRAATAAVTTAASLRIVSDTRCVQVPVSVDAMPYLLDHRFFRQRPDWPDLADSRPVVPATTVVDLAMSEVARAWPGSVPVAVRDAEFRSWLVAFPPHQVDIRMERGADLVRVDIGSYASMTVRVATSYPPAPAPRLRMPRENSPVPISAEEVYEEREMFHGPRFRGIAGLTAVSDHHLSGTIRMLPARGALLDNVGQLLGIWLRSTQTDRLIAFPRRIAAIDFFGQEPPNGAVLDCVLRADAADPGRMDMDAELCLDGRLHARVTGWHDVRLDGGARCRQVYRFPENSTLSEPQPGGWELVADEWPSLSARDFYAGVYLNAAERHQCAQRPRRSQRHWLLGRMAAKDAVRRWLWQHGSAAVFPAEVEIRNDRTGRPYAVGSHGRDLPPLDLSLAHSGTVGAAMVRPASAVVAPGIDVQKVVEPGPGTLDVALGIAERALLTRLAGRENGEHAGWFTRFWAAKEAVGKALGTGLSGRPRDFLVAEATGDRLLVGVAGDEFAVGCTVFRRSDGVSPAADYVAAWTIDDKDGT
ncbi:type I polyketide synthase [Fodinicola acaciae]|uniref:type I polyketide synthase n=1 Tax=Fodinicola acaciae TaxID=2681555 RepID=UPI0013D1E42E|nr:type I polyketide synthase [Fodinicola acaciae]